MITHRHDDSKNGNDRTGRRTMNRRIDPKRTRQARAHTLARRAQRRAKRATWGTAATREQNAGQVLAS